MMLDLKETDKKESKSKKKGKIGFKEFDPSKYIELEPTLKEAKSDTVVFSFGRMNPVTIGHEKLVNKVKALAKSKNADARIYLSHTQNNSKDPLSYRDKIRFAKKAFGNVIIQSNAKQVFQVAAELEQAGYKNIIMVVGSDRIKEFQTILDKYNGKDYNFNSISVVSAGERDPNAQGVEGMSGTKLRGLAVKGQFDDYVDEKGKKQYGFGSAAASKLSDKDKMDMMKLVQKNLKESEEISEAPLTRVQRLKRSRLFRRIKHKIKKGRERASRRRASMEVIRNRANKQARLFFKQRLAKGLDYKELPYGQRQAIDTRLAKISPARIKAIAKRLIPKVKKREMDRVKARTMPSEGVAQDKQIKDMPGTQPKKYYSGLDKKEKESRARQFARQSKMSDDDPRAYKPAPGDEDAKTKPSKHTKKYDQMFGEEDPCWDGYKQVGMKKKGGKEVPNCVPESLEENEKGLKNKSKETGISYGILKKVYDRGMAAWRTGHRPGTTPEQWGMARVNSFVTKGKGTWGKADKDLADKVRKEEFDSIEENKLLHPKEYKHAADTLQKVWDRKKGDAKHSIEYYAAQIARQYDNVNARQLAKMVNEEVSQKQIDDLEKFADRILAKFDVDVEFTKHFVDRMNDKRNSPEIKVVELQKLFKKIQKNKAQNIKGNVGIEAVLKDLSSDLNLPVVIKRRGDEIELVNKTIMRKSDFKTSNKVIKYEDTMKRFNDLYEASQTDMKVRKRPHMLLKAGNTGVKFDGRFKMYKKKESAFVESVNSFDSTLQEVIDLMESTEKFAKSEEKILTTDGRMKSFKEKLKKLGYKKIEERKSSTGYELYHKDFSSAMKHAYEYAKKKYNIEVDPEEIDNKVASGPRKPSAGKTNSYRLLDKDGKRAIQVQVYNMDNKGYELNMYKEDVNVSENKKMSLQKKLDQASEPSKKGKEGVTLKKAPWEKKEGFDLGLELIEGINDPGIFKAVFLAGGPGSGKSFMVGRTALTALGLKLINSDPAFEAQLKKVGLKPIPDDIFTPKGQAARDKAKSLVAKQQKLALDGRLGLVIDGTGKDYDKIEKQAKDLKALGYDVAMIFVNTNLETAISRDAARERTLGAKEVTKMWQQVQDNIGKFQSFFGNNMIIVDNSEGANWQKGSTDAYKKMSKWVSQPPSSPMAKKWIASVKAQRGITESDLATIVNGILESKDQEGFRKLSDIFKREIKMVGEGVVVKKNNPPEFGKTETTKLFKSMTPGQKNEITSPKFVKRIKESVTRNNRRKKG